MENSFWDGGIPAPDANLREQGKTGMYFIRHLQLRWKMLIMVMPLVLLPLILVAIFISNISIDLAYQGITRASKEDLLHMSDFSLDLLEGHYRQYEVYKKEREIAVRQKLRDIVDLAHKMVQTHHEQFLSQRLPLESVKRAARSGLKFASVGENGYVSVMSVSGDLLVHPVSEGKNILRAQDEEGRFFIQEMCDAAVSASPDTVLYTSYSWKDVLLGDQKARNKIVAYRYFPEWGWVISASSHLDELYDEEPFQDRAFNQMKKQLKSKKIGESGILYAASCDGVLVIHPLLEGKSIYTWLNDDRMEVMRRICDKGVEADWSHTVQQRGPGDVPRASIARLAYFEPWNWVIFAEAYEDELFGSAKEITKNIVVSVVFLIFLVAGASGMITFYAAKRFTFPIFMMTREIEKAKGSRQVKKISVPEAEELKKLAEAFNNMSDLIKHEKELEEKLAKMEKMASIGVLSSGVAHEINNPMGVILGYACHIENKLDPSDPNYHFVQEIKEESKRCVRIVRNLLDYARAPRLNREEVAVNNLVEHITDFATGHREMENIILYKELSGKVENVVADGDQLRQVIMNLLLNSAASMGEGGEIRVSTELVDNDVEIVVADSGHGIPDESLREVYEPFFTTKAKGTGLGLAISKQIIEAHLGSIHIESLVGEGTVVRVRLPVKDAGR